MFDGSIPNLSPLMATTWFYDFPNISPMVDEPFCHGFWANFPRHSESLNPNVLLLNPRVPWATGSTGETSHDHGTKIGTVIHHSFRMWTFRSFWGLLIPTLKVGRSGECQVTGDEILWRKSPRISWRKSPSSPRIFPATSTVHHSSITMFLGKKWYKLITIWPPRNRPKKPP